MVLLLYHDFFCRLKGPESHECSDLNRIEKGRQSAVSQSSGSGFPFRKICEGVTVKKVGGLVPCVVGYYSSLPFSVSTTGEG